MQPRRPAGRMSGEPLANRLRPRTLDEVVGQAHLLGPRGLLRRMVAGNHFRNLILFGPPGTGKTTLARVLSLHFQYPFFSLNAVSSGVKDLREVIALGSQGAPVLLHVDEVHRFARNQVEALLPSVEDGSVVFVGTTTENPYLSLPPALRSRSLILELKPLHPKEVLQVLRRALTDAERGLGGRGARMPENLLAELAEAAGGDLRVALNTLELAVATCPEDTVDHDWLEQCLRRELSAFSEGDAYDGLSALQKSIRGSDPDAALVYLARLVSVRFDLAALGRRLVVMAAEDVGNAYPHALTVAWSGVQAALFVGYPEARIPLAQVVTLLASCPKSNASLKGLDRALADLASGLGREVPVHLRDAHYAGAARLGRGLQYRYPHDYPGGWVAQQYLPDDLVGRRYYEPSDRGNEKAIKEKLDHLRKNS